LLINPESKPISRESNNSSILKSSGRGTFLKKLKLSIDSALTTFPIMEDTSGSATPSGAGPTRDSAAISTIIASEEAAATASTGPVSSRLVGINGSRASINVSQQHSGPEAGMFVNCQLEGGSLTNLRSLSHANSIVYQSNSSDFINNYRPDDYYPDDPSAQRSGVLMSHSVTSYSADELKSGISLRVDVGNNDNNNHCDSAVVSREEEANDDNNNSRDPSARLKASLQSHYTRQDNARQGVRPYSASSANLFKHIGGSNTPIVMSSTVPVVVLDMEPSQTNNSYGHGYG